jgi:uncharacterized membrane protein
VPSWPCVPLPAPISWSPNFVARLVRGVGDLIAGIGAAVVTALLALIFAPDAALVAYVADVIVGPLIGANLLHLREFEQSAVGVASISAAGTFDSIVRSGVSLYIWLDLRRTIGPNPAIPPSGF